MRRPTTMLCILSGLALAGCQSATQPDTDQIFVIEVSGERFQIAASDPVAVARLEQRRLDGIAGVIAGTLVEGDGGINPGWSWHLDPETVHVPDAAIELCDGRPSMVEADLTYWLGQVGSFCPWGAIVVDAGL